MDVYPLTCDRIGMAMRLLFGVLALALLVIAWSAWQGGITIVTIGALVIAGWMGWMALNGLLRR